MRILILQGIVQFDKNGIRISGDHDLKLSQYRSTFLNGSYVDASCSKRLELLDVAYMDNGSLKFQNGNSIGLWPGIGNMHLSIMRYLP